jgi:23S rRNA pseudouridine1911/1915/1917 synthase
MMKNLGQLKYIFFSSEEDLGSRLDVFLSKNLPDLSRSKIQSLVSSGLVFQKNLQVTKNSHKISSADEAYSIFEEDQDDLQKRIQKKNEINVNFSKKYNFQEMIFPGSEDQDLLVINKPAGLLSQNKPGENGENEISVSKLAKDYICGSGYKIEKESWEKGREFLAHRLDKETSGLMIIPKTIESFNFLKTEFIERRIKKKYKGVVWGVPTPLVHRLENEIRRDRLNRTKMIVITNRKILMRNQNQIIEDDNDSRGGPPRSQKTKTAITNYRVEKILFGGAMSLVEFEIETGRTHQIRLQMSFFGHPIVFDDVYGGSLNDFSHLITQNNEKKISDEIISNLKNLEKKRHLLHSWSISFLHPKTKEFLEFDTGDDFSEKINLILKMN